MSKLVCVKCRTELRCEINGTAVVEMADFGVCKFWDADTYKCPGCGIEVVSGFGQSPIRADHCADHYADDFDEWLENFLSKASRVVYDFPYPQNQGE